MSRTKEQEQDVLLINKVLELSKEKADWEIEAYTQRAKCKRLTKEVKRLREALSFYANEQNYDSRHGMAILKDCGDKAREGLK